MATMTEYDFTQQVDFPCVLVADIQASTISTPLVNVETVGSGPTMEVSLFFSDVLSAADQTTLNSVMSSYVNSLPAAQVVFNQVSKDVSFGMGIIAQFGAANRIANLSTANVIQIAEQLATIQALLSSGSIETALTAIQALTPSTLLTQTTITYFAQQLQNYLSSQG
jgi:hypothetical protein